MSLYEQTPCRAFGGEEKEEESEKARQLRHSRDRQGGSEEPRVLIALSLA